MTLCTGKKSMSRRKPSQQEFSNPSSADSRNSLIMTRMPKNISFPLMTNKGKINQIKILSNNHSEVITTKISSNSLPWLQKKKIRKNRSRSSNKVGVQKHSTSKDMRKKIPLKNSLLLEVENNSQLGQNQNQKGNQQSLILRMTSLRKLLVWVAINHKNRILLHQ